MPYGKKSGPHMESAKQERKDLMQDNASRQKSFCNANGS